MSESAPRSGLRMAIGGLVLAAVAVVYAGTLTESRWTGAMAPCTRVTDHDDSTWQTGDASMRWLPPMVHCHYPSTEEGQYPLRLPEATNSHVAAFGIALAGAIAFALAILVVAFAVFIHVARRRTAVPSSA